MSKEKIIGFAGSGNKMEKLMKLVKEHNVNIKIKELTPKEALEYLEKQNEFLLCDNKFEDNVKIISQALTNYANMVESLEGLVEKYRVEPRIGIPNFISRSEIIADITKVLEVR
jgi:nicotinate-nucleotide pyrophosphorylase